MCLSKHIVAFPIICLILFQIHPHCNGKCTHRHVFDNWRMWLFWLSVRTISRCFVTQENELFTVCKPSDFRVCCRTVLPQQGGVIAPVIVVRLDLWLPQNCGRFESRNACSCCHFCLRFKILYCKTLKHHTGFLQRFMHISFPLQPGMFPAQKRSQNHSL